MPPLRSLARQLPRMLRGVQGVEERDLCTRQHHVEGASPVDLGGVSQESVQPLFGNGFLAVSLKKNHPNMVLSSPILRQIHMDSACPNILWMREILCRLGWMKPYDWGKLPTNYQLALLLLIVSDRPKWLGCSWVLPKPTPNAVDAYCDSSDRFKSTVNIVKWAQCKMR